MYAKYLLFSYVKKVTGAFPKIILFLFLDGYVEIDVSTLNDDY